MANPEHLRILEQGVEVWNKWREENQDVIPNLSGTDLNSADIQGVNLVLADLSDIDLTSAQLNNADIRQANLWMARLENAQLSSALLSGADIVMANLDGADLTNADLVQAKLIRSTLINSNFSRAFIGFSIFGNIDLRTIVGLDEIIHGGPSTIGIDTIYKSKGKIPEAFLRGCGVPEDLIKLIPSLVAAEPFQLYKCFISHSTKNHLFCDRLHADLQSKGVRCWYFPEDARWGRSVWGEIDKPIKIYDKLILVCSKQSLNSPAVLRELERALQREDAEGKRILFPIYIDMYLFNEWDHPRKADVIAIVAGNFCGWEDPAVYQEKFDRLMRDLKASEK